MADEKEAMAQTSPNEQTAETKPEEQAQAELTTQDTEEGEKPVIRDPEKLLKTLDKLRTETKERDRTIGELKRQIATLEGKLSGLSEDALRAKQLELELQELKAQLSEREKALEEIRAEAVKNKLIRTALSTFKSKGLSVDPKTFSEAVERMPVNWANTDESTLLDILTTLGTAFATKQAPPAPPATTAPLTPDQQKSSEIKSPLLEAIRMMK